MKHLPFRNEKRNEFEIRPTLNVVFLLWKVFRIKSINVAKIYQEKRLINMNFNLNDKK